VSNQVATGIAVVFILLFVAGVTLAAFALDDEARFDRARQLIVIVAPLVGTILGYYFNKTVSDPRIENAEQQAQTKAISLSRARTALASLKTAAAAFSGESTGRAPQAAADDSGESDHSELHRAISYAEAVLREAE
jgi:hypothetical protein